MGTIAEKKSYLLETKALIKQAIINKGVEVLDTDTFRDYKTKIDNITEIPKVATYNDLPTDATEGDIYLVEDEDVKYLFGTEWINLDTVIEKEDILNISFDTTLDYSYLFKSGRLTELISVFFETYKTNAKYNSIVYYEGLFKDNLVITDLSDYVLDLTYIYGSDWGKSSYLFSGCENLINPPSVVLTPNSASSDNKYTSMFENCKSMVKAPSIDLGMKCRYNALGNMFAGCTNLTDISGVFSSFYDTCYINTAMFKDCENLKVIPTFFVFNSNSLANSAFSNTGIEDIPTNLKNIPCTGASTFRYCKNLTSANDLNITTSTSCQYMFADCPNLIEILNLSISYISGSAYLKYFVENCPKLNRLTLKANTTLGKPTVATEFSIKNCNFSKTTLEEFFNSLPTSTVAKKITITGNPGLNEEGIADVIAIATTKGYSIITS